MTKSGPHSNPRTRPKSKSGCRTCKIRKVKCDETRPTCSRCSSTGRKCEGYGYGALSSRSHAIAPRPRQQQQQGHRQITTPTRKAPCVGRAMSIVPTVATKTETYYMDWFRFRTAKKLPGPFDHNKWEQFVLRMSYAEPAVLHAVLALSSAHERESYRQRDLLRDTSCIGTDERFMLSQYSKAITKLKPHLAGQSTTSIRIVLISCLVFASLDYLRGRLRTGNQHLHTGMKLAAASIMGPGCDKPADPMDKWLVESFCKLNLQTCFLRQGAYIGCETFGGAPDHLPPIPVIFQAFSDARTLLDWLQSMIWKLSDDWHCQKYSLRAPSDEMLERQQSIMEQLGTWEHVYTVSQDVLVLRMGNAGPPVYKLLLIYHSMARIMASACFLPQRESTYDAYTLDFLELVNRAYLVYESSGPHHHDMVEIYGPNMSTFVADKGAIPPLYFTALKCRVRPIRQRAIRILHACSNKEALWDADLAASISLEVMRLEEGPDAVTNYFSASLESMEKPLTESDVLCLPTVPESHRLADIQAILPDDPGECAKIVCSRSGSGQPVSISVPRTWGHATRSHC